jgi:hypothetical protein
LEQFPHDRLLAFETKRVYGIDEVDTVLVGNFSNHPHGVVEVAADRDAGRDPGSRCR